MPVVAVDIPDPKEGTRLPPSISLTTPPPSRANAPHRSPLRLQALLLSRSNHGPTGSLARSTPDNSTPPLHTPPPPLPVSALPAPQITPVRTYPVDTPASSRSTPLRSFSALLLLRSLSAQPPSPPPPLSLPALAHSASPSAPSAIRQTGPGCISTSAPPLLRAPTLALLNQTSPWVPLHPLLPPPTPSTVPVPTARSATQTKPETPESCRGFFPATAPAPAVRTVRPDSDTLPAPSASSLPATPQTSSPPSSGSASPASSQKIQSSPPAALPAGSLSMNPPRCPAARCTSTATLQSPPASSCTASLASLGSASSVSLAAP